LSNTRSLVLKTKPKKADDAFDQVEQREHDILSDVHTAKGGEVYKLLNKIFTADTTATNVALDDEQMVKWMTKYEETTNPWQAKVNAALNEDKEQADKMEEEDRKKSEDDKKRMTEREAHAVDKLKAVVSQVHVLIDQIAQLGDVSKKMLKQDAKDSAEMDNAKMKQLELDQSSVSAAEKDAEDQARADLDKIQDNLQGTTNTVSGMNSDLNSVLAYSEKVMAEEKRRLDERAMAFNTALVHTGVSSAASNTAESTPAEPSALMQRPSTKRIAALLQKNAILTKINAQLNKRHQHLGDAVKSHLREHSIAT